MTAWESLLEEAKRLINENPTAKQAIVLRTLNGNVYHLALEEFSDGELLLLQLQEKDDVVVRELVCLWNSFEIDVPSMAFRRGLLDLSAGNGEAEVLLQGENRFIVKKLQVLMPG